jgi:hypothetical protein
MSDTKLKGDPAVESSAWLAANLKSRNGDTLNDLNKKCDFAIARKIIARQNLREAEAALRPLREAVESAESEEMNIRTRLNIWWQENGKKYEAANADLRQDAGSAAPDVK